VTEAGGNWIENEKEDIYLGIVQMDTVRNGFYLGELFGLFLYGKTKKKVYITVRLGFKKTKHYHIMNIWKHMMIIFLAGAKI
jgi:hypothetical protein